MTTTRKTTTTRTTRTQAQKISELRSEIQELRSQLEIHEECLQITADALRQLQKSVYSSAPESSAKQKTAPEKKLKKAPKGLRWADLSREGKSSWNAYAFRSQTYGRSEEAWKRWSVDRQTMIFPREMV